MTWLRNRLGSDSNSETGLSLIEVLVAMLIFALLSTGVAYSLIAVLKMTNDARSKQTATNLAASAIDTARATDDVLGYDPSTTPTIVDGVTYTVAIATGWVNSTGGSTAQCSSGSGAIIAKSVNVSVTWPGMTSGTAVTASTVISPDARLNDINKGVIIVSVKTASGAGYQGVTIKAVPSPTAPNGATAITSTIDPTDSQGCGVILQVVPGTYVVSLSKTGGLTPSVDITQNATPSVSVDVTTGSSTTAAFQYDQSGNFSATYHSNYNVGTIAMPTNMDTSFVNTYNIYTTTATSGFQLHPFPSGYYVLAGKLAVSGSTAASCKSVDPAAWPTSTDGLLVGKRSAPVATTPGGTITTPAQVTMGVFTVTGLAGKYILATSQTTGQTTGVSGLADPGCAMTSQYLIPITSASQQVALPFGTWKFMSGTISSQTSTVGSSNITPITLSTLNQVSGAAVLTLDPRTAP